MGDKIEMPANYVTGVLGASGGYDEGHLIAAEDSRRICGIATFLKAPLLKDVVDPTIGIVGIPFDGAPGAFNAITDVAGVEVGYTTLISGEGKRIVGQGPVHASARAACAT